jgi:hypothetical protein
VIYISAEIRRELEAIYEEMPEEAVDGAAYRSAFAAAPERRGLSAWMHEALREADAMERGFGTRFIAVRAADSRAGYEDMQAFIETVARPWLQERLWAAIRGRGAFRRFKDVLADSPAERERWFAFKDRRMRERALAWLADEGIAPIGDAG